MLFQVHLSVIVLYQYFYILMMAKEVLSMRIKNDPVTTMMRTIAQRSSLLQTMLLWTFIIPILLTTSTTAAASASDVAVNGREIMRRAAIVDYSWREYLLPTENTNTEITPVIGIVSTPYGDNVRSGSTPQDNTSGNADNTLQQTNLPQNPTSTYMTVGQGSESKDNNKSVSPVSTTTKGENWRQYLSSTNTVKDANSDSATHSAGNLESNSDWRQYLLPSTPSQADTHSTANQEKEDEDKTSQTSYGILDFVSMLRNANSASTSDKSKGSKKNQTKENNEETTDVANDSWRAALQSRVPKTITTKPQPSFDSTNNGLQTKDNQSDVGDDSKNAGCYYIHEIRFGNCNEKLEIPVSSKPLATPQVPPSGPSTDSSLRYPTSLPPQVSPPSAYISPVADIPVYHSPTRSAFSSLAPAVLSPQDSPIVAPSAPVPSPQLLPTISIPSFFTNRPDASPPISAPVDVPQNILIPPTTSKPTTPPSIPPVSTSAPVRIPTNAPTTATLPTVAPATGIVEQSPNNDMLHQRTVMAKPALVNIKGLFDPGTQRDALFDVVRAYFAPYSRAYIGDKLKSFELTEEFVVHEVSLNARQAVTNTWSEIKTTFHLESANLEDVEDFSVDEASKLLQEFFRGTNKQRLMQKLEEIGIVVELDAQDAMPGTEGQTLPENDDNELDNSPRSPTATSRSSNETNHGAIIAAITSGTIILMVVTAILLMNRKKENLVNVDEEKDSITGDHSHTDVYSGSPVDMLEDVHASGIKPAALQVRNRKVNVANLIHSSNSTVSSYQSTSDVTTYYTKRVAFSPSTESQSDEEEMTGARVTETAIIPFTSKTNESNVAFSSDGEGSVGAISDSYSDLHMHISDSLASPAWSVGSFSDISPYTVTDNFHTLTRKNLKSASRNNKIISLPKLTVNATDISQRNEDASDDGLEYV